MTKTPSLLCVEVLSRKDRISRTLQVMEDYLAMGVRNLWVLDPEERVAYTYTAEGLLKQRGPRLEVSACPIFLDCTVLFAALD